MQKSSVAYVIANVMEKFPPKHKLKKEETETEMELMQLSREEIKKRVQKMILVYHPDHVNKEKHGNKYFVLCEEVTKFLTSIYESMKGR